MSPIPTSTDQPAGTITVMLSTPKPRPRRQFLAPRPRVLVVVSADGFVEVFASPGVRVHIAQRLAVEAPEECLAESYLESRLPAWCREIFVPRNLATCRMPDPRTAEDEVGRRLALAMLAELRKESARG